MINIPTNGTYQKDDMAYSTPPKWNGAVGSSP